MTGIFPSFFCSKPFFLIALNYLEEMEKMNMLKRLLELLTNVFNPEMRMKRTLEKNDAIHRSTNYAHSSGVVKGASMNGSRSGKIQGSQFKGNTASSTSPNRNDDTLTTTLLVSSTLAATSTDSSCSSSHSSSNDSSSNTSYSDTSSCDSGGF